MLRNNSASRRGPGEVRLPTRTRARHGTPVVSLVVALALTGCTASHATHQETDSERNKPISVTYIVTTSTPTTVEMNGPAGRSQLAVDKDQTTEFTAHADDILNLHATAVKRPTQQNTKTKVTCEIRVDGISVVKESGEGMWADAGCSYQGPYTQHSSEKPSKDISVEFKVVTTGQASVQSRWSASSAAGSSTRSFVTATGASFTVRAKSKGAIELTVGGSEVNAGDPAVGCEILVDGKTVSKQETAAPHSSAACTYFDPRG